MGWLESNLTLLIALMMFALGIFIGYWVYGRALERAQRDIEILEYRLVREAEIHEERLRTHEDNQDKMHNTFALLSQRALQQNNQQFLQLAQENLRRFQSESQLDLEQRQQSIQHLVQPLQEALQKAEVQIQALEKSRVNAFGALHEQLRHLSSDQAALRQETGKLATALKNPAARGQWGELTLKRIVELAGMTGHCDFYEQESRSNAERTIRPDMIVRMPDKRELIVDAKTPLDAFLQAADTEDEKLRALLLQRYAKTLREHVRLLAAKRYWEQFEQAPDFVVLFVPGEQFLGTALEQDKNLLADAMTMKVVLASPTTLMALLRAVAFGWKQAVLTENATQIRDVGEELHKRLSVFVGHMDKLGKQLGGSVETYNRLLGSLERSVLPSARKMEELGISSERDMAEPLPLEQQPRPRAL